MKIILIQYVRLLFFPWDNTSKPRSFQDGFWYFTGQIILTPTAGAGQIELLIRTYVSHFQILSK